MVSQAKTHVAPSRRALPQEVVDGYKRDRVALALAEVASESSVGDLTVTALTKRAKIARNTFYELFANRHDAVRYSVELGNRRLREAIDRGADQGGGWQNRVRGVISTLLAEVAAEPALAELSLVQGGVVERPPVGPFDPALIESFAGVLHAGRRERQQPLPGPRTEELLACGILTVVAQRLRRGEAETLPTLSSELAEIAMLPFTPEAAPSYS